MRRPSGGGPPLHETLLLAVAGSLDQVVVRRRHRELGYALAAAVLLDLERTGRVEVRPDEVLVRDYAAAADPVGDALLERMVLADRALGARAWLERGADGALSAVRAQLLEAGRMTRVRSSRFGLFPVVGHLPSDAREAARLAALVRAAAAAEDPQRAPEGAAARVLATMLGAARLGPAMGCAPAPRARCSPAVAVVAGELSRAVAAACVPLVFGG
ncbi:GPP34 family phosphoprotein [Streptomyces sp. NPDC006544]|uniref:GPP34 family phosphoprotein n=1 Tax=Streptomyces sp. NPDC006544 TaxID=3154583 RepID=UPI0033A00A8E